MNVFINMSMQVCVCVFTFLKMQYKDGGVTDLSWSYREDVYRPSGVDGDP